MKNKILSFILLFSLIFSCFGCGSNTSKKSNEDYYTAEEIFEYIDNFDKEYSKQTEYMTDEERQENAKEICENVANKVGIEYKKEIKVRGYYCSYLGYLDDFYLYKKDEIDKKDAKYIYCENEKVTPELLFLKNNTMVEVQGKLYGNNLKECKIVGGIDEFVFSNNVMEIFKKFEDEDTYIVDGVPEDEFEENFVLMGMVSDVYNINQLKKHYKKLFTFDMYIDEEKDYSVYEFSFYDKSKQKHTCYYIGETNQDISIDDGACVLGDWKEEENIIFCNYGTIVKYEK